MCIIGYFLVAAINDSDNGGKGFVLAHILRMRSLMVEKAWQQERELVATLHP